MKRKINRVGTGTLTISLPAKWARLYNLKAGDEIDTIESGGQLIISTSTNHQNLGKISIHLKKGTPLMKRFMHLPYRDGYDEIEITSEDLLDKEIVKKGLRDIMGFELIESLPKKVVLRNIATPNESELESMFRRLFHIILNMASLVVGYAKNKKQYSKEELEDLENSSNRFAYFCQRVLLTRELKTRGFTLRMYHNTALLEQVADDFKRMGVFIAESDYTLSESTLRSLLFLEDILQTLCQDYYKQESLVQLRTMRTQGFREVYTELKKKLKPIDYTVLSLILSVLVCVKCMEVDMYDVNFKRSEVK